MHGGRYAAPPWRRQAPRQYYDASWRLIYESIDDGWSSGFTEDRVVEQFWGLRYIDDAVLRRVKSTGGSEGDYTRHHYLTDVQFSVVAVMASNGGVVERVRYTPYGEARHFWGDDVNGDLQTDFFDWISLANQSAEPEPYIGGDDYVVEMDLDRDGDIDVDDANLIGSAKSALPSGWISDAGSTGLDNMVGYDGYLFLPASEQYHVRFRCYDPELGRWLERDPAGYVDSASLYEYVRSSPVALLDPSGLKIKVVQKNRHDYTISYVRDALQKLIGDCGTVLVTNPRHATEKERIPGTHGFIDGWRTIKHTYTTSAEIKIDWSGDPACACDPCVQILLRMIRNANTFTIKASHRNRSHYGRGSSRTVEWNRRVRPLVWTDPGTGDLVLQEAPPEITLWHELMHQHLEQADIPNQRANAKAGAVNPFLAQENVGRECFRRATGATINDRYTGPQSYLVDPDPDEGLSPGSTMPRPPGQ